MSFFESSKLFGQAQAASRATHLGRMATHTVLAASLLLAQAVLTPVQAQSGQSSIRAGEPVTLNFENAEIEAVARTMATITGRNVVVDPRVRGTLNLVTAHPVSARAAFDQFLVALRMQGFTVVEDAGLYKVVPEADAKLQAGTVRVSEGAFPATTPRGGQIVTQIFRLNYENAANLVPTLRPLISPNNTINVNPGTNALVITDYADNLARLAKVIAALDVAEASDVEVIPLQHALAVEMVPLLNRLTAGEGGAAAIAGQPGGAVASGQGFRTTILADTRSNAIVVRAANAARVAQIRSLVQQLDQPPAAGSAAEHGNIHVVFLKNANATQLAQTLRAAISAGQIGGGGAAAAGTSAPTPQGMTATGLADTDTGIGASAGLGDGASSNFGQVQAVSTGGIIQADPSTNSLIITAPDPLYRQLRNVIDKLDGRRAQVMIESLVAEVRADKVAEFGIQWQAGLGSSGDSNVGALGTNFSTGSGGNIVDLALAAAMAASGNTSALRNLNSGLLGSGMNLGVAHNYGGDYVLGFLARFLDSTGDANVLSTPNILTLDNEEARIMIGSNLPFVTGSYTGTGAGSGGNLNPFQTIERQDVGLSLRVKPQINENGTVRLAVVQEVSNVLRVTEQGPETSKRLIETNILVEDGGIVVLGGLLEDRYMQAQDKVPLLGDIPVLGNAFRSEQRQREKVNLMVFLRPTVIYDASGSDALAMERYDMLRADQGLVQPSPHLMMRGVQGAPQLPPLPQQPELSERERKARDARRMPPLSALSSSPMQARRERGARSVDVRKLRTGESSGWVD